MSKRPKPCKACGEAPRINEGGRVAHRCPKGGWEIRATVQGWNKWMEAIA